MASKRDISLTIKASYQRTQATQPYSNVTVSQEAEMVIDPQQVDVATATAQLHAFCKNHVMFQLGAAFPQTALPAKTAVLPLDLEGAEFNHLGTQLPEPVQAAMLAAGINPKNLSYRITGDPAELESELDLTAEKKKQ